jgi:nitrite reductase (NADH) large subunit
MRRLVVAGYGMVGHKLIETLVERGATSDWEILVFAEEPRPAYDRVNLSSYFTGATEADLSLAPPDFTATSGITFHLGDPVTDIDAGSCTVTSASGRACTYDSLVLATGSVPFVPPVLGRELPGCFVYRTLEDLVAIRAWASSARTGVVVGGGLLGLEAANALRSLGMATHVVECAPRLMPTQVDDGGAIALRRRIEDLGVAVRTASQAIEVVPNQQGAVSALRFGEGPDLDADLVVFSAGIRPRDELGRAAGLEMGGRGGVVVDDGCRTSDPRIYAVGECALAAGRIWGLVGPGYEMARVVADQLRGEPSEFTGADCSTKLKLLGVDVATFGDAFASTPSAQSVVYSDSVDNVYQRLVLDAGGRQVLGGILVGDIAPYQALSQMARGDLPTPEHPQELLGPGRKGGGSVPGVGDLVPAARVCSCNNVSKGAICEAISADGLTEVGQVKAATRAGTGCGGCVPVVTDILKDELVKAGVAVSDHMCEHFPYSRQELFDVVRVSRVTSFAALLAAHGRGRGCDICKPAVASMLASLGSGHILDGEQASLQDTNDHFLANLQRDGTYSVVPRVPGGEITPRQLVAIGEVAQEFDLYTKITGAQRIDMFGARVEHLPQIWERLIDAGLESGHAYGKALRTVKSCVGHTWCRYGVQDSTSLAIRLERRYRGLRAPHKIKAAVSGCVRECAEAQGKDFGVIATERGWNLYVCGNGGARPQHGVLFAEDLDTETLIRYLDRFLMYYIRTADRLERTAPWLNKLEGGVEYLRSVVVDDSLGLGAALESEMERHVAQYRCEWQETLDDPNRLRRFRTFVNSDEPDPDIVFVRERDQPRPRRPDDAREPVLVGISGRRSGGEG